VLRGSDAPILNDSDRPRPSHAGAVSRLHDDHGDDDDGAGAERQHRDDVRECECGPPARSPRSETMARRTASRLRSCRWRGLWPRDARTRRWQPSCSSPAHDRRPPAQRVLEPRNLLANATGPPPARVGRLDRGSMSRQPAGPRTAPASRPFAIFDTSGRNRSSVGDLLALRPERSAQVRMPPTAHSATRREAGAHRALTAGPVN